MVGLYPLKVAINVRIVSPQPGNTNIRGCLAAPPRGTLSDSYNVAIPPGQNPNFLSNESRRMKPPRRRSLTLAAPQKNTLCSFHFARAGFFLLKGKECFAWLCSERAGGGAGLFLYSLGRLGIPPPQPHPAEPSSRG